MTGAQFEISIDGVASFLSRPEGPCFIGSANAEVPKSEQRG